MKKIWEKWKKIAEKLGRFQAGIIFSILYFLLITPVGLIANFFSDFLQIKKFPKWKKYNIKVGSLKILKNQY